MQTDKSLPFVEVRKGLVWHYTDAGGLYGMLRNNELWASSYLHLNDGAEVLTGIAAVEAALACATLDDRERDFVETQIRKAHGDLIQTDTFILSASTDGDSLSQWRGYAGGSGFAVAFDASEPLDVLGEHELEVSEEEAEQPGFEGDIGQFVSGWRRVYYDAQEHERRSNAVVEDFRRLLPLRSNDDRAKPSPGYMPLHEVRAMMLHTSDGYAGEVILMKDGGFKDEREVRMYATMDDIGRFQQIRPTRFGLTPYVRLTAGRTAKEVRRVSWATTARARLPIKHIRVGPTPYPKAALAGLHAAFEQFGYRGVETSVSEVPYR